eukprot:6148509-Amphidinium_carterae.1
MSLKHTRPSQGVQVDMPTIWHTPVNPHFNPQSAVPVDVHDVLAAAWARNHSAPSRRIANQCSRLLQMKPVSCELSCKPTFICYSSKLKRH